MAKSKQFPFTRKNYYLLLISVGLLILGFILMIGNENAGPSQFNEDIFSFRRITLAPLILLTGYMVMIYAIMLPEVNRKTNRNDGY